MIVVVWYSTAYFIVCMCVVTAVGVHYMVRIVSCCMTAAMAMTTGKREKCVIRFEATGEEESPAHGVYIRTYTYERERE